MISWDSPGLVDIPVVKDHLGALGVVEKNLPFPFPVKRVYFLYDVPADALRGSHAHKALNQLIIAVSGSFAVELDDGTEKTSYALHSPDKGLRVPPGYWRTLSNFSGGAAALVFASEEYDPSDYIRDYDEFVAWSQR